MTTVRDAIIDLFRSHNLTTWFGNPGSSELALLQYFPDDFHYFLGLQEMIPVGMADAYAQVTGRPASSTCTPPLVWATLKASSTTPTATRPH